MMNDIASLEHAFMALLSADKLEQAEALLKPFLASGSGPIPIWRMLSQTLRRQGRIPETRAIQQMLVDAIPGDLPTRFDLSETLLLLGEFERGWKEYRYRYSLSHTRIIDRKVQQDRWDGQPIGEKTLLVHDEQGYGDTFQFLQLLYLTKERSQAKIILEINPETLPLAKRSLTMVDRFVPRGELPPPFDVHCELMSLPAALGLQLIDLPGPTPYLLPDPGRLVKWRKRLAGLSRPIVAVNWAGRPSHFNDANRSMALATLAPLAASKTSFVAIQKGPAADQAKAALAGMNLISLDPEIDDFDDTAAILHVADLLISVDSAPVHLAGALGRPAWVMLPFVPDWRWLLDRKDTPWYSQHKLFRQKSRGDWSSVVAEMAADLADYPWADTKSVMPVLAAEGKI